MNSSEIIKYIKERAQGFTNTIFNNYGDNWAYYNEKYKTKEELLADFSAPVHKSVQIVKEHIRQTDNVLKYTFYDVKSDNNLHGLISNLKITSNTFMISQIKIMSVEENQCDWLYYCQHYEIDNILSTNIIPVTRNSKIELRIYNLPDETVVNIEYDYHENIDNIEMRCIQIYSEIIYPPSEGKWEERLDYNLICGK